MKHPLIVYIIACLWCWGTLAPLKGIPLWVLLSGEGESAPASNPIEFVAKTNSISNGTASPVTNLPTVQEGDLMLMAFSTDLVSTADGVPPSGWVKIASQDAGADGTGHVFYKWAGASEPASVTWTNLFTGSTSLAYGCVAYRYCIGTGSPVDVSQIGSMSASTSWVGSVVPNGPNRMVVAIFTADQATGATFAFDSPATERLEQANGASGYVAIGDVFAPTAVNTTIVGTASASDTYARFIIALLPE